MDTTIITGPTAANIEELTRDRHGRMPGTVFTSAAPPILLVAHPSRLHALAGGMAHQHAPLYGTDGLAEILGAPDVAARTYTLDMGDGTDRVIAVYRRSDRFGYAWNITDPRQSEYGYILD